MTKASPIELHIHDNDARDAFLDQFFAERVADVVTVHTTSTPTQGIAVTVLARQPEHQRGHLYGAAFITDLATEPEPALPCFPYTDITAIDWW